MEVIVQIDDDLLEEVFDETNEELICQEVENALGDYFARPVAFSVRPLG